MGIGDFDDGSSIHTGPLWHGLDCSFPKLRDRSTLEEGKEEQEDAETDQHGDDDIDGIVDGPLDGDSKQKYADRHLDQGCRDYICQLV